MGLVPSATRVSNRDRSRLLDGGYSHIYYRRLKSTIVRTFLRLSFAEANAGGHVV